MLNKVIKFSFALVGSITGFSLTRTFLVNKFPNIALQIQILIYLVIMIAAALAFYFACNKLMVIITSYLDKVDSFLQKMTLYELIICAVGLIAGLIVANLICIPINRIDIIGTPIAISINILFGCLGITVAISKKNENILSILTGKTLGLKNNKTCSEPKILDTSVIIDGRIVDICRSGFLEGELVIPSFILEELRHIADSAETLKRNRGRRGLDVLNMIQKDIKYPVRVENVEMTPDAEVDNELLKLAKKLGGKVLTIDYNLNKVASFQGVSVLNINELANAVKPIALPGEEMIVQVLKDGKENGQGIGYLDDGTMIVIDGGRTHIGESLNVTVTSVLQTAAGRMIFAKPKYSIERVI